MGGVGLTAFGTNSLEVVNELKELMYTDSAVAGESAGIALGMVLVGSGAGNLQNSINATDKEETSELLTEMKNYVRETHHEKIIRGIGHNMPWLSLTVGRGLIKRFVFYFTPQLVMS